MRAASDLWDDGGDTDAVGIAKGVRATITPGEGLVLPWWLKTGKRLDGGEPQGS